MFRDLADSTAGLKMKPRLAAAAVVVEQRLDELLFLLLSLDSRPTP